MNLQALPILDLGVNTFRVPSIIVTNRNLRMLSGNALALFIAISHRCFTSRSTAVRFTYVELFCDLDMTAQDVSDAAKELRKAGILRFTCNTSFVYFQLLNDDGTIAKHYLIQYGAAPTEPTELAPTEPTQD
jgi:hypothetical protein